MEIHDSLTPVYSEFYWTNKCNKIMGLSATVDTNARVFRDNDTDPLTKGDLIKEIAPICYSYTIDEGQADETSRPLIIYEVSHKLNTSVKNITGGSKAKPFMTTEYSQYQYLDNQFKRACFLPESKKSWAVPLWARKRADLLYSTPSKVKKCKELVDNLNTKTVIFGNSINALEGITDNVVSSRNSEKVNTKMRNDFDKGKIKTIGSFKMLKQGANLKGVDNCIIHSYYSKEKDLIQRVGRLRMNGSVGHVFIFVTAGTKEESWYTKMLENINSFEIIKCYDVEEAIEEYQKRRKH